MYYDKAQAPGKSITVTPPSTKDPARLLKARRPTTSVVCLRGGGSFPSGPARPSHVLVYNAGPARQAYRGRVFKGGPARPLTIGTLFTWRALSAKNQGDQLIPIPPSAAGILPPSPLHSTEKLVRGRITSQNKVTNVYMKRFNFPQGSASVLSPRKRER